MGIGKYSFFGTMIVTNYAKWNFKSIFKEMTILKFVTGYSYTDQVKYLRWPAWTPQTWNSVCLATKNGITKIYSNGHLVATVQKDLSGYDRTKNVLLLATSDEKDESHFDRSTFGAITDVNIWNKSLSQQEINGWSTFKLDIPKLKLLKWTDAKFILRGTQVEDFDLETIKKEFINVSSSFSLYTPKSGNSFRKGKYNCEGIGGYVSIPGDNTPLTIWNQSTMDISNDHCHGRFFTGYSELFEEDSYVSLYSNTSRSGIKWAKGEPNNWNGQEDCQEFSSLNNHANDIRCNKAICMICQLPSNTVFHLQGTQKFDVNKTCS